MAKTILIAEDFADDAVHLQQALKDSGIDHPVITVSDGDEVMAYFNGEGRFADRLSFPLPAVLLLDLRMPRVDGFQVLEWLQKQAGFKELLVVVISGYQELKDVNLAYQLGARSFITKPCKPEDIKLLTTAFAAHW
jgi:CheY-like chemotaxis protein